MCQSIHTKVEQYKLPTPKIICDSCDVECEQEEIEEVNGFFLCNTCADTDREASAERELWERDPDW